jgi:MYXO-CTERM domain-containing protein
MKPARRALAALVAAAAAAALARPAAAEPVDPVVIGWWSYFTPEGSQYQIPTNDPAHPISNYGDPNVYYYEPSGGHGLQDPTIPPAQAWQSILDFIFAHTDNATLSSSFTIDTSSDLQTLQYAYFGWALVLLYVPKDEYCDTYRIHIGSVDDGVQAMANAKILGYAKLGQQDVYIDMVEYQTNNLVLRPGINEVVLIHADQAKVQRYIHNVWIEHNGTQIPLAPKNILYGQVTDAASAKPIYRSTVTIAGGGAADTFLTGPFGYYFFDNLQNGAYSLTADAAGYKTGMASGTVAMGMGSTEVVRADLALAVGCSCPSGKVCGPSGGCLDACVLQGELEETCADPAATCVDHVCVKDPCDTLTCAPGFYCESAAGSRVGNCVELACSNVCCGKGQICSAGACVADRCAGGCPAGQTCSGGQCVDACSVITCAAPLVCRAGQCEDRCVADPASCAPPDAAVADAPSPVAGDGAPAPHAPGSETLSSGCGCRAGGAPRTPAIPGLALALAAAFARRRRRRATARG